MKILDKQKIRCTFAAVKNEKHQYHTTYYYCDCEAHNRRGDGIDFS